MTNSSSNDYTEHYMKKLDELFDFLSTLDVIDSKAYAKIVETTPCDLAARLRLVPDESLSMRLAHLYDIYVTVTEQRPIGEFVNYSLISIEGSFQEIPFDCDLVIESADTMELMFVDFTSSRNSSIISSKLSTIKQNITVNKYSNALSFVKVYTPRTIKVDIQAIFSSNEPGTLGLKMIDHLCTMSEADNTYFLNNCKEVYERVTRSLALMDNTEAPGDYKNKEVPMGVVQESITRIKSQDDAANLLFLKALGKSDPAYYPYYDALKELCRNSFKLKPVVTIEAAATKESRDLVATLSTLTTNWLAKGLYTAALTDFVVCVDEADAVSIVDTFPKVTNEGVLSDPTNLKVAIQKRKEHVFRIVFGANHIDKKLARSMIKRGEKKDKTYLGANFNANVSDEQVDNFVTTAIKNQECAEAYFSSLNLAVVRDNIWKKILTVSALSSNDLDNFGRSTTSMLDAYVSTMNQTYLGACIAHHYEISKSILASLKVSPKDDEYYVGVNGSYESVSVVKMSSTLDSFSKCSYSIIFKPEKGRLTTNTRLTGDMTGAIAQTHFYTTDPNQLAYSLKLPYIITSLATWEIENNMEGGLLSNGVLNQILLDTAFIAMINRDQFAQASEQTRYFYMSSIGYGGSAPEIVEKTTFMNIRHPIELLYLLRAYKLSAALCSISSAGSLSEIDDKFTGELEVVFPHSHFVSKSFTQTVSSMYICNIYNKFRAFHEVSEAMCYNSIVEENSIYRSRIKEDVFSVSGLSPDCYKAVSESASHFKNYIYSAEFIDKEVKFAEGIAAIKSKRYCGSAAYMIGATEKHAEVSDTIIDSIYASLNKGPVAACTMRGSMDVGPATEKRQGIRAASTVLEQLIREAGSEPGNVNKSALGSVYMTDKIAINKPSFSILSCVVKQFTDGSIVYRYRIEQKDQKGHREISVLNFDFRIGALLVETVSRELSLSVGEVDICSNHNKDKIIEDTIKTAFIADKERSGTSVFDNSDQKRWGPNHNVNFFSYVLYSMLKKDKGLLRLVNRVFDLTMDKRAKFPEALVDLICKKNVTASNSKPIDKFIKYATPMINNKIFESVMSMGMCQGIYQDTSSIVHAVKQLAQANVVSEIHPTVVTRALTTSDDAEVISFIPHKMDKIAIVKEVHCVSLRVGNLFNIIRSNPKSAFNFRIAELNSIFIKRGVMATPSIKQRIAKIDVGSGLNHIEDFLSCLSSASNYMSSGGSYMGTVILSVLNLVLHTEQWLRWGFVKSDHYYKPVEMGGFPVIEPISCVVSGGISNLYQRVGHLLNAEAYSRLVVSSLLCPPEEVSLEDFARQGSERVKKSMALDNLTVLRGAGPMGMVQHVRTDRKLSQFERRHGISTWVIPESFASLRRDSPLASYFLFSIFRSTSVSTLDNSLGVNSFFIRMAEPWVSYTRKCMKISDSSPFSKFFTGDGVMLSHKEFNERVTSLSPIEAGYEVVAAYHRCTRREEFMIMEAQLAARLADSMILLKFLLSQEAESFRVAKSSPSIQDVTLRGHTASDSDSYLLAMIKTLSGRKSERLINEYKRSLHAYDNINVTIPTKPIPVLSAVVMADNAISLYNKFIRRSTKMTLPNKVEDLRQLCLDIINNKFTERFGMILEGDLELNPERSKPYAHSKWYQEILTLSQSIEDKLANSVLKREEVDWPKVGIVSERAVLTRNDMFEISNTTAPEKTVVLDAKSKDHFVNMIRTWMAAKVRFTLTRNTINSLIDGKLTFAHDYYIGSNQFYRYTKGKYFEIKAGQAKGMHVIQTTIKDNGKKRKVTYRHLIYFGEDVTNRSIDVNLTPGVAQDKWLINLRDSLTEVKKIELNRWNKIKSATDYGHFAARKADDEEDFFKVMLLKPGSEFKSTVVNDSLCISLVSSEISLPVTYLNPEIVNTVDIGYTLTHADMVVGTEAYMKLRTITGNFSRARIAAWKELTDAFNFVLVGSTTDTPEFIINKIMFPFINMNLTTIQLDILRTFLIKNPIFGIGYSSSRFTQYLLNMGKRRRHEHSYLCKTVTGTRADADSEDWDVQSAKEEIFISGGSNAHEFNDVESDDGADVPEFIERELEIASAGDSEFKDINEPTVGITADTELAEEDAVDTRAVAWAEDVIEQANDANQYEVFDPQTAQEISWSDTESEESDALPTMGEVEHEELITSHNTGIPEATVVGSSQDNIATPELSVFQNVFSSLLSGMNLEDVFDPDGDSVTGEDNEPVAPNYTDTLDTIFSKALAGSYEKIKDVKDKGLKSEKSGHTVSPSLESSRSIVAFLKEWVQTTGSAIDFDQDGIISKDLSSITGMYVTMHAAGALPYINVLERFYGVDSMRLPVGLSALAVVGAIYF